MAQGDMIWRGAVSGLSYSAYGKVMNELSVGTELTLKYEPHNPFDKNAIGVYHNAERIAWIPRGENEKLAQFFAHGGRAIAVVTLHSLTGDFSKRLFINVFEFPKASEDPKKSKRSQHNQSTTEKEEAMITMQKIIDTNTNSAKSAAYMEAGRIANNEVSKLLSKQLPLVVRGYADTAAGRLVIANIAVLAAQHFRSEDRALNNLAQAMTVQAYQELLQTLELEEFFEKLLSSPKIKTALGKLKKADAIADDE